MMPKYFAATLLLIAPTIWGFQEAPMPAFDAVSVKHVGNSSMSINIASGDKPVKIQSPHRPLRISPTRVTCVLSLASLMVQSYGVRPEQIQGPKWLDDELYDVTAVMPADTPRATALLMMRQMLAERFGLKLHHEQKEFAIYALVVAKTGLKAKETDKPANFSYGFRLDGSQRGFHAVPGMPMRLFADVLTHAVGRPVVDETNAAGTYSIDLSWSAYPESGGSDSGIVTALPQLGLRLESKKAMWDVLVIDNVAKEPTEN
jgi:uncharacterized protein (TIGR03435 family)